jgi:hypothetical protein
MGIISQKGSTDHRIAANQLCQAVLGQMPGTEISLLQQNEKHNEYVNDIVMPLMDLKACGVITGIPTLRKDGNHDMLQTLDNLAFGNRDNSGYERDYSVIVVADPVPDSEISDFIKTLLNVKTEVYESVNRTIQEGNSTGNSEGVNAAVNVDVGAIIGSLITMVPFVGTAVGGLLGVSAGINRSRTVTYSKNISKQYMNMSAQYSVNLLDKYIKRLEQGRNLGFWNTGIYVLGDSESTVNWAMGVLRAVYSGDDSYIEPIRGSLLSKESGAIKYIKQFQLLPYPYDEQKLKKYQEIMKTGGWHPLGPLFEGITTPLNTEELSIATSLPRRDVPGLRFVRNAVRFATNPPKTEDGSDNITLGQVMDTGVPLNMDYTFNINTLTKHALVTGITGSGKSTTCRTLLNAVLSRGRSFMVIEPAKEEYVAWAFEQNKKLGDKKIRVYMPGASDFKGNILEKLRLNPFQPASTMGGTIDMTSRLDRFKSAFIASLPMADVLPLIIEESLYEHVYIKMGPDYLAGAVPNRDIQYPLIGDLPSTANAIITGRGYDKDVQSNLKAAVRTRINALTLGWKGDLFNTPTSTPYNELFDGNVVINLSRIADDKDKALIMSLLLISLAEYRESQYRYDAAYQDRALAGELCHFTVIEEAHRLLKNPERDIMGTGNAQAASANMFCEMLSEIRAYGQGLLIVDQIPSRLVPDVIKNTNLKIVHRLVAKDDRESVASCMALRPDQADTIAALPTGQAIICGDSDDAASWLKINK